MYAYSYINVRVGIVMDTVLDGSVEDIFGLFSCQMHSWFKSRSGTYQIYKVTERYFDITIDSHYSQSTSYA